MKFYPADWRADPRLRMCSLAARGLWIEMIALMHEAKPYGHLIFDEKPLKISELSELIGCKKTEIKKAFLELVSRGVCSIADSGTIYSRRMIRDNKKRLGDVRNGGRGGNPKLVEGVNPPVNPRVKGGDKAQMLEARARKKEKKDSDVSTSAAVGAAAPVYSDSRHELWGEGVAILGQLGIPEKPARSNIGRWLKSNGDDCPSLLAAILRAREQKIIDPIPWITRALTTTGPPRGRHKSFAELALELDRKIHEHDRDPGTGAGG